MRSARSLVAASYDRAASKSAGAADQHVYGLLAAPLVAALERAIDVPGPVLDVAAGAGAIGRHFEAVVAVDISIEQLRHNAAACRLVADGERLPFRDGAFVAAACGFGINHVARPDVLVEEMARVGGIVGLTTWERPEAPYEPKRVVFEALASRAGRARSRAGAVIDRLTDAVGSVDVIHDLFESLGMEADVRVVDVDIPWPGIEAYLAYRLSMPTSAEVVVDDALRDELRHALASLPPEALTWRPRVIVGVAITA